MWKVFFEEVEVFFSETDVEAIQFALSLHQATNVKHCIEVLYDKGEGEGAETVCTLNRS